MTIVDRASHVTLAFSKLAITGAAIAVGASAIIDAASAIDKLKGFITKKTSVPKAIFATAISKCCKLIDLNEIFKFRNEKKSIADNNHFIRKDNNEA